MKRICIRFVSISGDSQTFTVCNDFSKYTSARAWLAWAYRQLRQMIANNYSFGRRGKKAVGAVDDYDVEIVGIGYY